MGHSFITRTYTWLYGMFHKVEKRVLFVSFKGKQYSDNPRAISEKLHELYPEYEITWYFQKNSPSLEVIPDYVRPILKKGKFNFEYYKALATSFCYVTNVQLNPGIGKRKGQFFIQTWHGDVSVKKYLYESLSDPEHYIPVMDGKYTDLCVAGSTFAEEHYRSAFHYYGEVLNVGTPRNDKLMNPNPEEEKNTRKKLGINDGVKILLYAPTLRDGKKGSQEVTVDLVKTMDVLEESGEKWVCLIRAHFGVAGLSFACDGDRFVDATKYPDMADLLSVSDMLITDYSSCAGDMIRCEKPVILALFDQDDYIANSRELLYDPTEVGFITAYDQEELNEVLRSKTEADYTESCKRLNAYFGITETGRSSEEICKRIDEFYKKNHGKQISF